MPKLRCRMTQLGKLAQRYEYESAEVDLSDLKADIDARGYLTKTDLRTVARWKSPRSAGYMEKNSDDYIQEISGIALTARTERIRIEVLTLLDGVQWPTASVVLHFFHKDPYPIVDFRALWSISMDVPKQYTFGFWWKYVEYCRTVATRAYLDMRELDQALWQYSKENQEPV
jgi:hypothetical protein